MKHTDEDSQQIQLRISNPSWYSDYEAKLKSLEKLAEECRGGLSVWSGKQTRKRQRVFT
jgi:hypothetical protein